MPRDIPVGNGTLLVAFDRSYHIRDLYYPHVGKESHVGGHPFRFGAWADGVFAWLDAGWDLTIDYLEDTLVTQVVATNRVLRLKLICNDLVDFHENVYLRRVEVHNLAETEREVRVFFHHDFHISESSVGDTANYDPSTRAVLHYKGHRYFLINLCTSQGCGIQHYTTGRKEFQGAEGTWRDAEDGSLDENPIAQGSVDSVVGVNLQVSAGGKEEVFYWIAVGQDHREVRQLNKLIFDKGPETLLNRTREYWRLWVNAKGWNLALLPAEVARLFKRSLLIIRTQIDNGGAILAANDSDVIAFNRDTYSYMWPRDGALVANALDRAGYLEVTKRFFNFCRAVIREEGFFLHKYNPDGSVASSWHPWIFDGKRQWPIQEDSTALVIWALWNHFKLFNDIEFIKPLYRPLIIRAANFMEEYRDKTLGLPTPSYDLWEERRGIHTFTVSAVYAGLLAAAKFAWAFGEEHLARRYIDACRQIKRGMDLHLYRPDLNRFARMIAPGDSGYEVDDAVDASLAGVFLFGAYDASDERVARTMRAVINDLRVQREVGGLARYRGDSYYKVRDDYGQVPGNPWFVCTLWWAQYLIAKARAEAELEEPLSLLKWSAERALPSGVLPEQIDPFTNEPLSVSPLTWSHASLVLAVIDYLEKLHQLNPYKEIGRPEMAASWQVEVGCRRVLEAGR